MRNKQNNGRLFLHRASLVLLTAALVLSMFNIASLTLADTEVQPPAKDNIFIYNIKPSYADTRLSAAYILTNGEDSDAIYKVYSAAGVLLGQGKQNLRDGYCAVPLYNPNKPNAYGVIDENAVLYVTRTVDGVESTRVAVNSGKRGNPTITLNMNQVDATKKLPTLSYTNSSGFLGNSVVKGSTLTAGKFYQVEVRLEGFAAIDAVRIPLRYDTSILKPATIVSSKLTTISDSDMAAARNGLTFAMAAPVITGYNSSLTYGMIKGMAFGEWYKGTEEGEFSTPTEGGAYQSINTSTGLIKLQASIKSPAPFGHDNFTPKSSVKSGTYQFMRFFFQATETVKLDQLPVWFATEDDCPEEAKNSDSLRLTYYDPASPNGISVTLGGAAVMMPPLPLTTTAVSSAEAGAGVHLTASEMNDLPETFTFFNLYAPQLQKDEVRIYNYTNSGVSGTHSLDGYDAYDRLVIQQSKAIRYGDTIRAYIHDGTSFVKIGETTAVNNPPVVTMNLGTDKLDPYDGGKLYVTVERDRNGESTPVEVDYPKEATRDVTFRICRDDWDDEHEVEGYYGNLTDLKAGTLLQMRIYFNNFTDLSSYGFALHFDPRAVRVANAEYEAVDSGTVLEQDYADGTSCFSPGADLTDVTLTQQVIYQAKQRNDANEISTLKSQLGISQTEFDAIAADVALRYSIGVGNGTQEIPWRGGLLFTEARNDNTSFPYVDNTLGYVQFMSASLEQPTPIERDEGYHFLSINFIVVNSWMEPDFRFAKDTDTGYCPVMNRGYQVVMSGGEPDLGINTHWEVAPIGTKITMTLADGNSNDPAESKAMYLYQGAAYRDPGFTARLATGQTVPPTEVKRYYVDANNREQSQNPETQGVPLPAYAADEELMNFVIPPNSDGTPGYSAHYRLYYEYGTREDGSDAVQMTREIYIIYQKGDVNRDGEIDLFDEQALADYINGYTSLSRNELYLKKTVDVNQDGVYGDDDDREALRFSSLGLSTIQQDYIMPAGS